MTMAWKMLQASLRRWKYLQLGQVSELHANSRQHTMQMS